MAQVLKDAGANVLITGRDEAKVNQVATEIGCKGLAFDVSNYSELEGNATEAVRLLGGIDVLINNAGIGTFPVLGAISLAQMQSVFGTNVFGLTLLSQSILPHFKKQKKGNIVNIASTAALKGFARGSVYAASKFAVRGLTQCWQAELRKENIRVMLVNPSEVPTAFNQTDRVERPDEAQKLSSTEIAHSIKAALEMDDRGFIPELSVWATNPWGH
jgi:3-oxoacyl-[acyl-carrier protein] reductase